MGKISIQFDGFRELTEAIDRAGKDLNEAVEEALESSQQVVNDALIPAAAPYARQGLKGYATGAMYGAIQTDQQVRWKGTTAEIGSGFTTNSGATQDGFYHSIFVMYGTPRMEKDQRIFNAIKGTKTKKNVADIQKEVMQKHFELGGES